MAIADSIQLLQDIDRDGGNVWESCVSVGIAAKEMLDEGRFAIGDLARIVAKKKYGKNAIGSFAHAIKQDVNRVREYRRVANFWEIAVRTAIWEECPALTYSDFKIAMRLKDLKKAKAFLREISDQHWSVEQARLVLNVRLGKPLPPMKLLDAEEVCILDIKETLLKVDVVGVNLEANEKLMNAWRSGKAVHVVIYEVPADEPEDEHEQ